MTTTRTRRAMMRTATATAALAALVGGLTAAPAQAAPAADLFCDVPGQELAISPIAELVDGQEVSWLSTTKGVTPRTFTGEYVGKLDNGLGYDAQGNPRDLLLVKLEGDVVDGTAGSAPAGVWAGASGSPVYDADGALIGAVSYGFSTFADNVAGVTPAAYMKSIGDLPLKQTLSAGAQRQLSAAIGEKPSASAGRTTIRQLQPVRVTTGTTAATLDDLSSRLAREVPGYRPSTIGGLAIDGGTTDGADYPIIAGGNIAVSFAYGAVGAASVGTVTAVCGDDVYAFGHPNEWNSALGASIHGASAARIVPDPGSYKLVSAIGKVKGTLTEDRLAGIKGTLGAGAATVPITTTTVAGAQRGTAVSHVSETLLIGPAAAAQLGTDALRLLDNQWEGSAKVSWTIAYTRENGTSATLSNTNRYSSAEGIADFVGWDIADDIAMLQMNPFEDVSITAVKIRARFTEGYRVARLTGVQMKAGNSWKTVKNGSVTTAARGKTYTFRAVLSPAPGATRATEYSTFHIEVPKNAKRTVNVRLNVPASPMDFADEPASFAEFVAVLDARHRFDSFDRTRAYLRTNGTRYSGTAPTIAPTVIEPGGRFSFSLQVPKR